MKWIAITAAAALVAAAAALAAHGGTSVQTTLHLVATQHGFTQVDTGKRGMSPGDSFVFGEALQLNGKAAGTDHVVCTFVGAGARGTMRATPTKSGERLDISLAE
jgi:hypothetical protein